MTALQWWFWIWTGSQAGAFVAHHDGVGWLGTLVGCTRYVLSTAAAVQLQLCDSSSHVPAVCVSLLKDEINKALVHGWHAHLIKYHA